MSDAKPDDRSKLGKRPATDFKLYWFARASLGTWLHGQYGQETIGNERLPDRGGALIVANHNSFLDIPAIGGSSPKRPVAFVSRENIVDIPILGFFVRHWGGILIRRGAADVAALREIVESLTEKGDLVCLFPEGTRSRDGELQPLQRGALFAARKAKVPMLAAGIAGTFEILPRTRKIPTLRGKIVVSYSEPISLTPSDDALERMGAALAAEVARARERWSQAMGRPYPIHSQSKGSSSQLSPNTGSVVFTPPNGGGRETQQ
jgi:1-acyl-sn-glycerol-3-phosphate acyltransferase